MHKWRPNDLPFLGYQVTLEDLSLLKIHPFLANLEVLVDQWVPQAHLVPSLLSSRRFLEDLEDPGILGILGDPKIIDFLQTNFKCIFFLSNSQYLLATQEAPDDQALQAVH